MADEAQAQAVQELDRVWKELLNRYKASKKLSVVSAAKHLQKVYICGGGVAKLGLWTNFMSLYHFAVKHVCIFITLCNMFIKS